MDNGAHFYNCDFQVHTPRDRQWYGSRAITDEEREEYAVEFIQACRENGLDAVAITDHHDTVFIEYIRRAAGNETDKNGDPVPKKDRIIVFPGMELTLGVPCQALLLFDAGLPLNLLGTACDLLNINQAPPERAKTREPERLDQISSLGDVYELLNGNDELCGRFVVFPNVTDGGGYGSIFRTNFTSVYVTMPCVGGYVDGSAAEMSTGRTNIIQGKDPNYGKKPIGLFQTSDNRHRDYRSLGDHTTWVKWAEPTAEALRQACLARNSRLWQEKPDLPSKFIKHISVSESRFMGKFSLSFNRQYNALIGGRGAGKSTVLEYLRWALGDEPTTPKERELSESEKTRKKLVEKTLVEPQGTVEVELNINGVAHVVRRHGRNGEFELQVGDQSFESIPKKEVRDLLPIQGYSQKQLSSVAVRIEELNRFVRAPIKDDLRKFNSTIKSLQSDLRSTYISVQKKRELERSLQAVERELNSVQQQIKQTKNEMTGLSDKDRKVLDQKEVYDREKSIVQDWFEEVQSVQSLLNQLEEATDAASSREMEEVIANALEEDDRIGEGQSPEDELPDYDLLSTMRKRLNEVLGEISERIRDSIDETNELLSNESSLGEVRQAFEKRQNEFQDKYSSVRSRADEHSERMEQLDGLEIRQEELRKKRREINDDVSEIGSPREEFNRMKKEWHKTHRNRSTILGEQCQALTEQSNQLIKASLEQGGQTDAFVNLLRTKVEGSNLYKSTMESIFDSIPKADDPVEQYSAIIQELESLAIHDTDESSELSGAPYLRQCGLEKQHLEKIAQYLTPEDWLDIAVTPLDDQPRFKYNVQGDQYIDFASASAGQQATALLLALLNQSGPPLIIDQPEDDLDNQIIREVVEEIWSAKHERQLIFASHNANLVVNGDADLVVCFNSALEAGVSSGKIEQTGAIDVEDICARITDIMEGGQDAFELRKQKYGF